MHMRKLGIALLVITFLVLSAPAALAVPVADFTNATPTQGFAPLRVNFTDLSQSAITIWNWSFGDGLWFNTTNPLAANASHLYNASGQFTVNLTVTNATGTAAASKPLFVNVTPVSSFLTFNNAGIAPQFVAFVDTSTGTPAIWNWSFGDATFSALQSPNHTYVNPGTYIVNLTVSNPPLAGTTSSQTITTLAPGSAGFETVNFTDAASPHGATRVLVYSDQNNNTDPRFGIPLNNTTVLMALRNLHYNYTATNNPTVFNSQLTGNGPWNFTIWNEELYDPPGGTYDNIRTYIIGGGRALVSSGNVELNRTAPLWTTLGVPAFRNIIFSNGSQNMYLVAPQNLVFTSPNRISSPVVFNGTRVQYGLAGYNFWLGAGNTLASTSPNFTYPTPLNGNISMVSANGGRTIFNGILPGTMNVTQPGHTKTTAVELWENEICFVDNFYIPAVDFTANNTIGNYPLPVRFTDLSTGNITAWNWSFGDGFFSALKNPTHVYGTAGSFNVNLTVTTNAATGSTQKNGYITVLVPPSAAFNTTNYTDPTPLHPGVNVLVYSDQNNNTNLGINLNNTAVLIALRNMHFNYTATNDPTVFVAQLNAPPLPNWSIVIWNEELYDPPGGTYDAIRTYILGGGRALVSSGNVELNRTAPLWTTLGVPAFRNIVFSNGSQNMYIVAPGNRIFTAPNPLATPVPFDGTRVQYGLAGYNFWLGAGSTLASTSPNFTYPTPLNGNISMVSANAGRTVFNGILPGTFNFTAPFHTKTTAVELWENEISSVLNLTLQPIARFTTNVTTGVAPLNVRFNDTSTGGPTGWNWSFGDGTFFNTTVPASRNASHTYATGTYVANLTVSNVNGSTTTVLGSTLPSRTITVA